MIARLLLTAWLGCALFSPNSMVDNEEEIFDEEASANWPVWQIDSFSCSAL